jgi:hypothetical protein
VKSYQIPLLSSIKVTPSNQTPQLIFEPLCKPKNIEEGPNESESEKNLLFRGTPIKQDKPELSASFYAEQNPAEQAQPHPYQLFVSKDYQSSVTFDIKPNPVGPIMTSISMAQTQVVADKAKEYGINKLTPFTGN